MLPKIIRRDTGMAFEEAAERPITSLIITHQLHLMLLAIVDCHLVTEDVKDRTIAVMRHPPLGHLLLKSKGVHNDGSGIIRCYRQ